MRRSSHQNHDSASRRIRKEVNRRLNRTKLPSSIVELDALHRLFKGTEPSKKPSRTVVAAICVFAVFLVALSATLPVCSVEVRGTVVVSGFTLESKSLEQSPFPRLKVRSLSIDGVEKVKPMIASHSDAKIAEPATAMRAASQLKADSILLSDFLRAKKIRLRMLSSTEVMLDGTDTQPFQLTAGDSTILAIGDDEVFGERVMQAGDAVVVVPAGGVAQLVVTQNAENSWVGSGVPIRSIDFETTEIGVANEFISLRPRSEVSSGDVEVLDTGMKHELSYLEALRLEPGSEDLILRSLKFLKSGEISLTFTGTVREIHVGSEGNPASLVPSWLEWISARRSVALLWAALGLVIAAFLSVRTWWSTGGVA